MTGADEAPRGPGPQEPTEGPQGPAGAVAGEDEVPEGAAADGPPAPAGPGQPLPDVAAVEHQRDEYLGALQRLQADFENYRKRVQRQQEEVTARAAAGLVRVLLPALDALDLAQAHLAIVPGADGEPELSPDAQALVQARTLLLGSLEKEGLERLDAPGVAFDPEVHDAVAHAPEGGEDGDEVARGPVVDEVLRAGYRWQGQTVRPAMVRVRG